ncbi:MAG: hypothetical protein KME21_23710 [Desmonostoc vinosum HA7617-LM4]|nr:hypothetical protein [Desmonostoc vinosum HA7617-LM4]
MAQLAKAITVQIDYKNAPGLGVMDSVMHSFSRCWAIYYMCVYTVLLNSFLQISIIQLVERSRNQRFW